MKKRISKLFIKNKSTKKQHVLLIFLGCSTLFWFLTNLAKEYETEIDYTVNYQHLPSSKLFQNTYINQLKLYVKATGFKLLKEQFSTRTINIGLQNLEAKGTYDYYLLLRTKQNQVQSQLDKGVKLVSFVQDTLFFELGFNKHKKVPVIVNLDLRFKSGYNLSNKVFIVPDSIEISGPEIQVDKITAINSNLFKKEDVSSDIFKEVEIVKPIGSDKVNFHVEHVQVVAEVEKFTEDSFNLPFEITDLPKGTSITTYPNTVKVVFQVGLSNYKKISANDFKVVCRYENYEIDNTHFLVPELLKKPALVSSVKIVPNRIEYLIQK